MHILLTGTSGFVGSALVHKMHDVGLSIKGAVRKYSLTTPTFVEQFNVGNITKNTDWSIGLKKVDVVIHLAARVHVMQDNSDDPLAEFCRVNTDATLSLAKQAAENGVKRFIYLSSIKVNGESTYLDQPFTEDDKFIPTEPYALSKYEAEKGLFLLAKNSQMEVVIIRPPLVYGPRVKANFLTMMSLLYRGIPLPLGAIHNKRSLVAIDNLVDLIVTCIDHPAARNHTFLVSDGEDLSTTELLQKMAIALGKPARLLPVNSSLLKTGALLLGKRDMAQRLIESLQVDISKTKEVLGWSPLVSVDDALQKTAKDFLARFRARD